MKKNIDIASESDDHLNELDRLVTQEIDALQLKNRKKDRMKSAQKRKSLGSDNVIFREGWPKHNESPEQNEFVLEEYETDKVNDGSQGDQLENDAAFVEDSNTDLATTTELFSEEELDFIQRATDWLATRENKDMIISRIWEQLTESVPESFYSVQQESSSETEDHPDIDPQVIDNTDINPTEPPS